MWGQPNKRFWDSLGTGDLSVFSLQSTLYSHWLLFCLVFPWAEFLCDKRHIESACYLLIISSPLMTHYLFTMFPMLVYRPAKTNGPKMKWAQFHTSISGPAVLLDAGSCGRLLLDHRHDSHPGLFAVTRWRHGRSADAVPRHNRPSCAPSVIHEMFPSINKSQATFGRQRVFSLS